VHFDDAEKMRLLQRWDECRQTVEAALDQWMPQEMEPPSVLHRAMRYAIFAGGKRLRPFLVLECCRAVGGNELLAMPAACAVEALHTHSLVYDDLPCMDDDALRRGKPTCHKVFGEGIAVLCGDALLSLSYDLLAGGLPRSGLDAETALRCTETLGKAAGSHWLCGGQAMDITEQGTGYADRGAETVLRIHERKTVALIQASCVIGGLIGGADDVQIAVLRDYGYWLGLAFQITDDILDETGDREKLGKSIGKDKQQKKLTYPMVFGVERSRELASEAVQNAVQALAPFDAAADLLRALALSLPDRQS
jgi:geranylgeranyl diphosphate synthase type II